MNTSSKTIEKTSNSIKNPAIIAASSVIVFALASIDHTMLAISIIVLSAIIAFSSLFQREKKEESEIKLFVMIMLTAVSFAAIKLYFLSDVIGALLK